MVQKGETWSGKPYPVNSDKIKKYLVVFSITLLPNIQKGEIIHSDHTQKDVYFRKIRIGNEEHWFDKRF